MIEVLFILILFLCLIVIFLFINHYKMVNELEEFEKFLKEKRKVQSSINEKILKVTQIHDEQIENSIDSIIEIQIFLNTESRLTK